MTDLTQPILVEIALVIILIFSGFAIVIRQIRVLHKQINSRMDDYIITLSKLFQSEGDTVGYARRVAEEKLEEKKN